MNEELNSYETRPKRWYKKWWVILIFIFLVIILILGLIFAWLVHSYDQRIKEGEIDISQFVDQFTLTNLTPQTSSEIIEVSVDDDPFWGSEEAKVVIVEFSDFQCPYCEQAFPIIKEIMGTYGDKIKFVYRDFPLTDIHPLAQKAAEAAQCAHEQGKFWEYHDKIFLNQEKITESNLKLYALQIGLDEKAFGVCLDSGKYQKEVEKDLLDGVSYGVRGTPTFFVNGRKFEGVIPEDILKQIIDLTLEIS